MDAVGAGPLIAGLPGTAIPELTALNCRRSDFHYPRLNLLVPALATRHVFGGIATALELFKELIANDANVRIILTDSLSFDVSENDAYEGWRIASLMEDDVSGRVIIPAGDRYGQSLSVGPGDRFVATAWWTAALAERIQEWQINEFALDELPRFLYLIQDYEPGFYPWSSRYALAEATYRNGNRIIALFNTTILRKFFQDEGYIFDIFYEFNPRLSQRLRLLRPQVARQKRDKQILIYGRPNVDRNAFQIIVEGLRHFMNAHPGNDWKFISAGDFFPPIEIGAGRKLEAVGKLTIEQYAHELGRSSIGISLMISPHPSYPPLEMSAYGMKVITNRYKSKDLADLAPNVFSLSEVSPLALADCLALVVARCEHEELRAENIEFSEFFKDYVYGESELIMLSREIRGQIFSVREK